MTPNVPRITDVRPVLLRAPIAAPVRMAVGRLQARQAVLVLIDTDAGLTGIGESWVNYPGWGPVERLAAITHGLRPLLLAGGENLYGSQFERWFEQGLLDIVQPDICKCGGLTAARSILDLATRRGLRLAPHYFGSAVGLAATVHLFASLLPGQRILAVYDINPNPLREELLTEPLWAGKGTLRVLQGTGLGVTLARAAITRYGVGS